ncbi:MAG: 5'-deoxyadenosine deaminase [Deltaproteobacteria bacterium]|nr:5'-deoxyadenosine deaminase [Deltaproteobacteria bacterium]
MAPLPSRIRLQGGLVVTMNASRDVFVGDVVMVGHRIIAVEEASAVSVAKGEASALPPSEELESSLLEEVIDCRGQLVIPGLIQPHVHLCQTLFRGAADGLPLLDWLKTRIWPFEAAHTASSIAASARLGVLELLRSGTTAILDMGSVRHTEAIFEVCAETGIRATIGKAMMDVDHGQPAFLCETTERALGESLELADAWHGAANGRLRYAFAPRFVLSCSEALLVKTSRAAREHGLLFHTHASENVDETALVRADRGMDNVAYLHHLGALHEGTVLAHCVWLSEHERQLLASSGAHVAHCPSSNLKLGSGVAALPELLEAGVQVGLAADGAACANNLDAFMEMRLAGLIHNPRFGPGCLEARRVVELATLGGANALGLGAEIGSLEVGKRADVVVISPDQLHAAPSQDPYSLLVYALRGHDVRDVFVDGVARVRRGGLVGVDVEAVLDTVRAEASRFGRDADVQVA